MIRISYSPYGVFVVNGLKGMQMSRSDIDDESVAAAGACSQADDTESSSLPFAERLHDIQGFIALFLLNSQA